MDYQWLKSRWKDIQCFLCPTLLPRSTSVWAAWPHMAVEINSSLSDMGFGKIHKYAISSAAPSVSVFSKSRNIQKPQQFMFILTKREPLLINCNFTNNPMTDPDFKVWLFTLWVEKLHPVPYWRVCVLYSKPGIFSSRMRESNPALERLPRHLLKPAFFSHSRSLLKLRNVLPELSPARAVTFREPPGTAALLFA